MSWQRVVVPNHLANASRVAVARKENAPARVIAAKTAANAQKVNAALIASANQNDNLACASQKLQEGRETAPLFI